MYFKRIYSHSTPLSQKLIPKCLQPSLKCALFLVMVLTALWIIGSILYLQDSSQTYFYPNSINRINHNNNNIAIDNHQNNHDHNNNLNINNHNNGNHHNIDKNRKRILQTHIKLASKPKAINADTDTNTDTDTNIKTDINNVDTVSVSNANTHHHSNNDITIVKNGDGSSIFNIWSDSELLENDICPQKYPSAVPKQRELEYICTHLHFFKFRGYCDVKNCSRCIPPHSVIKDMKWCNEDVQPWVDQYHKTTRQRRHDLQLMINTTVNDFNPSLHQNVSGLHKKNLGPILVLVINHGYLYLLFNFLCSLDANGLSFIRNRTLIVAANKETHLILQHEQQLHRQRRGLGSGGPGFMLFHPEWLGAKLLRRIDPQMPKTFALGAHRWIVALQIAVVTDLVHLGYDVVLQDSDIIYARNPFPFLLRRAFKHLDLQMSVDGRLDYRGPGNSGYYYLRANCKTRVFMDTMISMISAVLVSRSDQILWNALLSEKRFRMLHFQTIANRYVVGGNQVNIKHGTDRAALPPQMLVYHASYTTDQFDKVEKLHNIDHWYFTQEKCPLYYSFARIPDLQNKKWHIRKKTQRQEKRLMALGLVKDSSNGTWVEPDEDRK